MADILARQRQIVGTADDWAAHDLVLGAGELALVREDGAVRARVGDGAARYSESPYLGVAASDLTFTQGGTGAVDSNVETELGYFIRPEQYGAVGDGVADDTAAIVAADTFAALTGAVVLFSAKIYKTTAKIAKSYKTWWQGAGNSFPAVSGGAAVPTSRITGTQIYKAHNADCIEMIGPSAYFQCGGIERIGVVSDKTTWPTGAGFVFDKIGSARVLDCRVWGVGGDGFKFGTTAGDLTGQFHVEGLYVNNPGGACIRNRSRWLKMSKVETDGGTYSYYGDGAPQTDITQFHFEGATSAAILLNGANANSRFRGGFINMTAVSATKAVVFVSVSGQTDITFRDIQFVGHAGVLVTIDIDAAGWRTTIDNCEFPNAQIAIRDGGATGTNITNCKFLACGLAIDMSGLSSRITSNICQGTTGTYSIDHKAGGGGLWSGNSLDKPIKATATGAQGNYGTNRANNNPGFVTRARGITGALASPIVVPHGLAAAPVAIWNTRAFAVSPFAQPTSGFTVTADATNLTIAWTSGGSPQFWWEAEAICDGV